MKNHNITKQPRKNAEGNYKLSAKDVMRNRQEYIAKQDRFFDDYFKNYDLIRGQSAKETSGKHINNNRFKAQKAGEDFKSANEQKDILENKITALEEVYQILQDELLEMANNIELYEEMLRRSIFEHDYANVFKEVFGDS